MPATSRLTNLFGVPVLAAGVLSLAAPVATPAAGLPPTSIQQGHGFMSGMPRPGVAAEAGQASASRRAEVSSAYDTPTPATYPGGLGFDVIPGDTARAAGRGTGIVEIFQRESPGIYAREVRLVLRVQSGLKIASAIGGGWVCTPMGSTATCRGRDVTPSLAPEPLKVTFRASAGITAADRRLYGRLSWRERRDAEMVAAGLAKPAPRGSRGAQLVPRSLTDYGEIAVDRLLAVKLDLAGPQRQPTGDPGMTTVIKADIANIEDAQVQTRWSQLCTSADSVKAEPVCGGRVDPQARFLQDATNPKAIATETMGVDLPDVAQPTDLHFRLEASDGGHTAHDEIKVTAEPFNEAVLDPRLDTLKRLDEIATPVPEEQLTGRTQKLITGSISGAAVATIRAGGRRTLEVRAGSGRVKAVRWSVVRGGRQLLAGSKRRGGSITLRPGSTLGARAFVLRADARLAGGDRLQLAKTVKVLPARARSRASMTYAGLASRRLRAGVAAFRRSSLATKQAVDRRLARISGEPIAGSSAGSPERTLCAIADVVKQNRMQPLPYPTGPIALDDQGRPVTPIGDENVPDLALGDGTMVWLGPDAKLSTGSCNSTSKIGFTNAQLRVGESTFIAVNGSITDEGLSITSGSYRIPAEWATRIPTVRDALSKGVRFTVPNGSRVRANIESGSGEWGALGGEIDLPVGLELLKLPGGWKFKPAKLGLESTGLVSLSIEAVAPTGAGATGGSVLMEGRMDPIGQAEIEVTASNVATIRQANGDQVAFSGGGKLTFTEGFDNCEYDPETGKLKDPDCNTNSDGSSLTVTPEVWVTAEGKIQLADNFALTKARMLWNPERFEAEMAARAGSEKSFVDFTVNGTYASTDEWNFGIRAQSDNWEVVDGLVVERLEGSVTRSKPAADKPGITEIYARAAARGWKPSPAFEVSSLDASLTNECPKDGVAAKECQTGSVRLNLDVKGKAQLPFEGVGAMDWESVASVNLSTLKFTLYGGVKVPDGGVGPEGLKLREIQINLSNERAVGQCVPRGPPVQQASTPPATLTAEQNLNFSLIAKGTVLGKDADFIGEFGNGLCLIGDLRGGMPADAPYADAYGSVKVAYSSFDATFTSGGLNYSLDARRVQLASTFKLPSFVTDTLKLSGIGRFTATVGAARDKNDKPTTGKSFDAEIAVEMPKGSEPVIFGERPGSHLGLDSATLKLVWDKSVSFGAATQMTYRTAATSAAQASGVADSQTPFEFEVKYEKGSASVIGGVDPQRSPDRNDKGQPVVNNAFGVQDLKVYGLAVSLTLGANTSLGFEGDTVLPARWGQPIGIQAGARIALAASISKTNPCFSFSISNEKGPEAVAVDVANAGLLSANELNLLLAPTGCVAGGKTIDPGFGFKFNGRIAGSFPLEVEANVRLPSPSNPSDFYIYAKLRAPAFELGTAAQFEQTDFELKLDPANSDYLVSFQGGMNVLGQKVSANARFESKGGLGNVKLDGSFQADIGVVGFNLATKAALKLDMSNYDIKTFGFDAEMRLRVLGTNLAGAKAEFLYNNRVIEKFNFELSAGINVGIAAAEGRVRVNYNLLRPNGATTGPFTEKTFKVGFGGKLRFIFWSTSFDWDIYSYRGKLDPGEIDAQRSLLDTDSAKEEAVKTPSLPWVSFTDFRREATGGTADRRITGVAYKVSSSVATAKTVDEKATSDQRGELILTTCSVGSPVKADGSCANSAAQKTFTALIDYPNRRIVVKDGLTIVRARDAYLGDRYEDVVLEGTNWDAMVKWVSAAREEYKKKHGRALPPMRAWSAQAPTAVGQVRYGDKLTNDIPQARKNLIGRVLNWSLTAGVNNAPRADGQFSWGPAFRFSTNSSGVIWQDGNSPGRTVPVTGDFDGDGYDDHAQFIAPYQAGDRATWRFRSDPYRDTEVPRGICAPDSYCQPVEPPGTPFNPIGQNSSGEYFTRGAMFPVVGDWDISQGDQSKTVDDLGVAFATSSSQSISWSLWPQNSRDINFQLGERRDRPVSGDFNGDGVADVGIYRPARNVNEKSVWYLFDLAKIVQRLADKQLAPDQALDLASADWTVELGQFGDMPVTGDWNNDGRAGVGVVSYADRSLGSASPEWKLQDFVEARCGTEACQPDHIFRYGSYDGYPIAGRWRP